MPDEIKLPVPKTVIEFEEIVAQIRHLSLSAAAPNQPAVVAVEISARDEEGNFRDEVRIPWRVQDHPASTERNEAGEEIEIPAEEMADRLILLIFTAKLDGPLAGAMGMTGMTVLDAGSAIIRNALLGEQG